ncbi:glycosyltransferase [Paenibacillus sp. H1-7]|uniref:glycosyltransferase n=1 Tax=Paenibacillus sp. H1-7 TaxID=2282849 RepID=UPI001EF816CB|nr:glycosyltransferase [Paenibacillus sp. H1-7]
MEAKLNLISIVIPCYNQGHYLKENFESIENSTYPYIEVVVVDDGSTSDTSKQSLAELEGYLIKNSKVKFIKQANQGPAAARNNGVLESSGEFILFLDADDKIDSTYIEKCVWVLTKYPYISFVYPSVQHFGMRDDIYHSRPYNFESLLLDNFIVVSSVIRRNVWEDTGGFDTSLSGYEDWDFWIRAGALGIKGYWLREPLFFYRRNEASRLVSDNNRRHQLLKELQKKNSAIFNAHFQNKFKKIKHKIKQKLSFYKWKVFVGYVRITSKIPKSFKDKLKKYIKPIIRKIFKYEETGYAPIEQVQVLEKTQVDETIESGYFYKENIKYLDVFKSSSTDKTNEKNSILFIVPWLVVGGADKVNLDLIQKFIEKGHDVHLFTTLSHDHPWHNKFKEEVSQITHLGNNFTILNELLDYVNDYIRAKKIQVIQMSNSQLGYQIAEVIKTCNPDVKIVDLNHMEEPYAPFDYFRYSVRYKNWFDHRVVITPYLKEVMVRKYGETPDRVTVIPNGIEVPSNYEKTDYLIKNQKQIVEIGFVGRMEEQKQPLDFIKTASIILKNCSNVHFTMVGDGSLLNPAKSLAKSLMIDSHIDFLGSRNDAPEIMKENMHIFFAPSIREGLPIVGLEALSFGIPIVATDVPGWSDLVINGETGFLTPVNDCIKMADVCIKLINDQQLRETLSRKGYIFVEDKFSLNKTSQVYLDIYSRLLNNNSVRTMR